MDFNQLTQGVPVGNSDIVASAIYIEVGGGINGEPGVATDAFDVNQGIFVDDDFVNVSPVQRDLGREQRWLGAFCFGLKRDCIRLHSRRSV